MKLVSTPHARTYGKKPKIANQHREKENVGRKSKKSFQYIYSRKCRFYKSYFGLSLFSVLFFSLLAGPQQ